MDLEVSGNVLVLAEFDNTDPSDGVWPQPALQHGAPTWNPAGSEILSAYPSAASPDFQRRFDMMRTSPVINANHPNRPPGEPCGWIGIRTKIEARLKRGLAECYGDDLVAEIETMAAAAQNPTSATSADFEKLLKDLVAQRANEILPPTPAAVAQVVGPNLPVDSPIKTRILQEYGLDLNQLDPLQKKFEDTIASLADGIAMRRKKIEEFNRKMDGICRWVGQAPDIFRSHPTMATPSVSEQILGQVDGLLSEEKIKETISEYSSMTTDMLCLLSQCSGFFGRKGRCSICTKGEITHACTPCGHCYCQPCAEMTRRQSCFTCRQPVRGMQRIYLP